MSAGKRGAGASAGATGGAGAGAEKPRKKGRGLTRQRARLLTTLAFMLVIAVGYVLHVGIGNACGIGFLDVALICPLGSLSAMIASKTLIPQAVVSLVIFVVAALLVGRAFCGWLCPTPTLTRILPRLHRSPEERERARRAKQAKRAAWERKLAQEEAAEQGRELTHEELAAFAPKGGGSEARVAAQTVEDSEAGVAGEDGRTGAAGGGLSDEERAELRGQARALAAQACGKSHGIKLGSAHVLLLVALVTTAVFGFPVFCAVCPVGLTFAFVLLVMRLFLYGELTWALLAFPAVVVVELVLLPRWCQSICPLGALHSLVAAGNRTWRPTLSRQTCLQTTRGAQACDRCVQACPQGIDLHDIAAGRTTLNDCVKCGACADACPTDSITFPLHPPAR